MSVADRWAREPRDAEEPRPVPLVPAAPEPALPVERTLADAPVREHVEPGAGQLDASARERGDEPRQPRTLRERREERWDADDLISARVKRGEEERKPLDLDQLQEAAWAIVGAFLYLLGVIAAAVTLTMAFAGWVGALVVLVAGGIPSGYSLLKASQRRAQKAQWDHFDAQQERTDHAATAGFDIPAVR